MTAPVRRAPDEEGTTMNAPLRRAPARRALQRSPDEEGTQRGGHRNEEHGKRSTAMSPGPVEGGKCSAIVIADSWRESMLPWR